MKVHCAMMWYVHERRPAILNGSPPSRSCGMPPHTESIKDGKGCTGMFFNFTTAGRILGFELHRFYDFYYYFMQRTPDTEIYDTDLAT